MSKTPRNPNGPKPTLTVASSNTPQDVALTKLVKQAASNPKVAKLPAATFSPEKLAELLNEITALRRETAELKAAAVAPAKPATGKPDLSAKNDADCVRIFKKAGFKDLQPRVNILTFRKWTEHGYRPLEGSNALRVNNLRLWHVSQVRALTPAEIKAAHSGEGDHAVRRRRQADQ
jgi:hypothetical protein